MIFLHLKIDLMNNLTSLNDFLAFFSMMIF